MGWMWVLSGLVAAVIAGLVWQLRRAPSVDEERCPYKIGTDRIDCGGPCEPEPPCQFV
jgi:hypothetical protein